MDPATRGDLYHAVQFELLRDLAARGLLPVTARISPLRWNGSTQFCRRRRQRAEADLAPAIPQIWRAEVQSIRADLRGWLQQKALLEAGLDARILRTQLRPARLRRAAIRAAARSPSTIGGGYQLQGSIDLVERHTSGMLRVVDHKTGRIPDPRPEMVGGGEVLQPALYALAAEEMLGEPVAVGRLYYSTIAQNYTAIDVPLHDWTRRRAQHVLDIDRRGHASTASSPPRRARTAARTASTCPSAAPTKRSACSEKSQAAS